MNIDNHKKQLNEYIEIYKELESQCHIHEQFLNKFIKTIKDAKLIEEALKLKITFKYHYMMYMVISKYVTYCVNNKLNTTIIKDFYDENKILIRWYIKDLFYIKCE